MKTLHYMAHIALLTAFVIFAIGAGFYITGSEQSKSAILSIFKKDSLEHTHTPTDIVSANAGNCRVCLELGLAECSAAAPYHLRHLTSSDEERSHRTDTEDSAEPTIRELVGVLINTLIPESVVKDTEEHMERDVLMTYAAWE